MDALTSEELKNRLLTPTAAYNYVSALNELVGCLSMIEYRPVNREGLINRYHLHEYFLVTLVKMGGLKAHDDNDPAQFSGRYLKTKLLITLTPADVAIRMINDGHTLNSVTPGIVDRLRELGVLAGPTEQAEINKANKPTGLQPTAVVESPDDKPADVPMTQVEKFKLRKEKVKPVQKQQDMASIEPATSEIKRQADEAVETMKSKAEDLLRKNTPKDPDREMAASDPQPDVAEQPADDKGWPLVGTPEPETEFAVKESPAESRKPIDMSDIIDMDTLEKQCRQATKASDLLAESLERSNNALREMQILRKLAAESETQPQKIVQWTVPDPTDGIEGTLDVKFDNTVTIDTASANHKILIETKEDIDVAIAVLRVLRRKLPE